MEYQEFLKSKSQKQHFGGFDPVWTPDFLFDFQKELTEWSIRKGKSALFEDCGLGKTPQQLVWAENIVRKTNKNVLILTPLAVSNQTIKEGEKFGIECFLSNDGQPKGKITVSNYEKLHLFDHHDYESVVCDESSILKNFNGTRKAEITEFMRTIPYRLLCTATASPNDYPELGTSSEALGELGYTDMLTRFFKNNNNTVSIGRYHGKKQEWQLKPHAVESFWEWISSWAKAIRKPSDLGYKNDGFTLPPLIENHITIDNTSPLPGELFVRPAMGLREQREELKLTLKERCEKAAELVCDGEIAVIWCNLNAEGDLLEKIIPDAIQVSGSDSDDNKTSKLMDFADENIRVMVIKPKIGAFGLNWQHCSHVVTFPTHSFEQHYQSVRRCWRFGQQNPVTVDIVTTGGGLYVLENLKNKTKQASNMFESLVRVMNNPKQIDPTTEYNQTMEVPPWL